MLQFLGFCFACFVFCSFFVASVWLCSLVLSVLFWTFAYALLVSVLGLVVVCVVVTPILFRVAVASFVAWVLVSWWTRPPLIGPLLLEDLPCSEDPPRKQHCGVPCVAHDSGMLFGQSTDRMEMEGEACLSVSSGAFALGRLRPRARWVRALEAVLGEGCGSVGRLVRGRWLPDLPSTRRSPVANSLLVSLKGGAKLLGGGVVQNHEAGASITNQVWYMLELPEGEQVVVFPDLLARLHAYCLFRGRETALLSALRARARDWCKRELPSWVWPFAMPPAIFLAWQGTTMEDQAFGMISRCVVNDPTLLSGSA